MRWEEESEKKHEEVEEVEEGEGEREVQTGEEGKEREERRAEKGPGRKTDQESLEERTGSRSKGSWRRRRKVESRAE